MLRHKNLPDKEIWDELKYWLQNPVTEKEQAQREQAETKFWNQKLNERFAKRKVNGVMTGAASSDGLYDAYRKVSEDKTLSPEEKVQRYQEVASTYNKRIEKEDVLKKAKLGTGALIALGSAAIPGGGVLGAKAAGALAKPLAQFAGRKMAELTANTIVRGGAVGAVEGLGRGMLNNENPLKTAATDAVTGMALGGLTGAGAAGVEKVYNKVKMNNYAKKINSGNGNINSLNKQEKKDYIKLGKEYYKDYEQGVRTKTSSLGDIKLSSDAIKETNIQSPQHTKDVVDLSKNIRKAEYVRPEPEKHSHKNYDIKQFHRLRGNDVDYIIAENQKGNKYFYKMTDSNLTGPKPEGQSLPSSIIQQSRKVFNTSQEWLDNLRRQRGHMK